MKKTLKISIPLLISAFLLSMAGINSANAEVDTFVPSTGVKIRPSSLAQKMEDATRKATQKNNNSNSNSQSSYDSQSVPVIEPELDSSQKKPSESIWF